MLSSKEALLLVVRLNRLINHDRDEYIIQSEFACRLYKIGPVVGAYPPSIYLPLLEL